LVTTCDGGVHGDPPRWHAAAAIGAVGTTLLLGGHDVDFRERSLSVSLERAFGDRFVLQVGGGAILDGTLTVGRTAHTVDPGWVAAAGFSYRLADEKKRAPFVLFSYGFAIGRTHTHLRDDPGSAKVPLTAIDLARAGLTVGKSFGPLTPFASARVFGGPVFWTIDGASATGGDRYHFQLATGASVRPGAGLDLFAEWAFVGERRVSLGVGAAF
jgi:hypothetical protein